MFEDLAQALVWMLRLVLVCGIAWGAWLCIGEFLAPARSEQAVGFEQFATFALLALVLITTLGGFVHAG